MKKYSVTKGIETREFLTLEEANAWGSPAIEIEYELPVYKPRIELSERQIKFALIDSGLFDAIDSYVQASSDKKLKVAWGSPFFWSDNELVLMMGQMLGKTTEEIYQIFQYGATL